MKILQVNSVFLKGSTGKIVNDIHTTLLENGYDSSIAYGRGKYIKSPVVYKFCTELEAKIQGVYNRLGGLMYAGNYYSTYKLIKYIKQNAPDVVHVHCINGYCVNIYLLFKFLAKKKIPTVVTHHGEFFYTGSCGHSIDCVQWQNISGCRKCPVARKETGALFVDRSHTAWTKMKNAFRFFSKDCLIFTAVSPWVKERSLLSPIVNAFDCKVVMNGVDTSLFHFYADQSMIRGKIPDCKAKIVLHVAAYFTTEINNLKGGFFLVDLARRNPNIVFLIVASYVEVKTDLPSNIHIWGKAKSQVELAQMYSSADLTIIFSKKETFSMVCAESLCCGTPVVGFKAGGPESISLPQYSQFVQYGNIKELDTTMNVFLKKDFNKIEISHKSLDVYSKEKMTQNYINVYKSFNR